jgi:DNA-binding MurR/RpiR family transcriptional regulator
MTAAQLAEKAGVSEATVVRLAQALGFAGYPDWREKLREGLQRRLSTVTRLERAVGHVKNEEDVLVKVLQEDIQNISRTLRDVRPETFKEAVASLGAARRVFVAGVRGAYALAVTLTTYLRVVGIEAHLISPGHGEVWDVLFDAGENDLVVGISLARYTRFSLEVLELARRRGAKVGAITDSPVSPLAAQADWVLTAHAQLDSYIESFTAANSLINALLTALSVRAPEKTMRNLKEREALWKEKGIYLYSDD